MTHYVIGCGGGGSWLVPKLKKLVWQDNEICLIDGDTLEEKNLDRQLFDEEHLGKNKALALADKYDIDQAIDMFFHSNMVLNLEGESLGLTADDILWCCADNHACRREVLISCDRYNR